METVTARPALLALDWGTSSLRAFLMDGRGTVVDQRASAHGIQNLPAPGVAGFEQAFAALCGDWLAGRQDSLPVVAGGMVGSAQGWREAPYASCPADAQRLAEQAVTVDSALGVRILVAPGVLYDPPPGTADGVPDVIRGEEIQIAGALADHPAWAARSCMAMPGTHSKWVAIRDGRIESFATYMTGELFAVLTTHSILGRLMPEGAAADAAAADLAFARGVQAARESRPGDLSHQIFATRTLGLTRRLPPELLKDYLSGLLIGHELVSGTARMQEALDGDIPLLLIGEGALCRRYGRAMEILGLKPAAEIGNTAPRGLFQFAIAAGLIPPAKETPNG
ncbi:2-dehydro-3-deoxygalactonokinase [Azospirillum thermophilum]|uniref:2-keto-3-deoxy-galactonokinase n=1 Tax=Azospirillum thermophilum TaxID=2202148 RepID=A0A2S2CY17_9PROT|nr:2-dehydro-3-deoxygalactonokinase [Azospirillum thermophilum]AWK89376.1 2-keto-3-deoxy-galactonokinase [Azospirillum thermophilum]